MTSTRPRSRRPLTLAAVAVSGAALGLALLPSPVLAATAAATPSRTSGPLGTSVKVTGSCSPFEPGFAGLVRIGFFYSDAFETPAGRSTFHEVDGTVNSAGQFSGTIKVGAAVAYTYKGASPIAPGGERLRKPKAGDTIRIQVRCYQPLLTGAYPSSLHVASKSFAVTKSTFTSKKRPAITGKAKVGKKLTASKGTWSPKPTSYSYQWKRAGKAISKATKSTYTVKKKDKGKKITVTVKAKRTGYFTLSRTSKSRTIS